METVKDNAYYEILDVLSPQNTNYQRWSSFAHTLLVMDGIDHLWNMDLRYGLQFIQDLPDGIKAMGGEIKGSEDFKRRDEARNRCIDFFLLDIRLGEDQIIKGLEALNGPLDVIEKGEVNYDFTRADIEYLRADIRIMASEMRSVLGSLKKEMVAA